MTSLEFDYNSKRYKDIIRKCIEVQGDIPLENFLIDNDLTMGDLIYAGISLPYQDIIIHYEFTPVSMGPFFYIKGNDLDRAREVAIFVKGYHGTPLPPETNESHICDEEEDEDLEEVDEETLRHQAEFAEFKRRQAAGELLSQPLSQQPITQQSKPVNRLDDHTSYPDSEYKFSQLLPVAAFCLPLGLGSLPLLTRGGNDAIWAGVLVSIFLYSPIRYLTRKEESSMGDRTIALLMSAAILWVCLWGIAKIGGNSSSSCWYIAGCI